ncbi:MAG: hypothetical protein M3N68_12290, partial [Actinomycetota bacterium]|nr:hypothetical protein [Actinomycetota bacterium]
MLEAAADGRQRKLIDGLHVLVLAATAVAVAGVLALVAAALERSGRSLVVPLAVAFAVAAVFAAPGATGLGVLDAALRAGLCGAAVIVAAGGNSWVLALAAVLALAGGASASGGWPAAAGFGLVAGSVAARLDAPVVKAAAGGLVALAAMHLSW